MLTLSKYLLIGLVGAGIGALVAVKVRPLPPPTVVEKIVQGKREIVQVDRTTERTTKPDGTIQEKIVEKRHVDKTETRREVPKVVFQLKSQYSLELQYLPSLSEAPTWRHSAVVAWARIGQSDWWVTAGYSVKYNQLTLGIRYEF